MAEDINGYFEAVSQRLARFDRDATVGFCLGLLEDGKVTVAVLYEQILAPALNAVTIARADEDRLIWQEHAMTSIVRSVIECARPYVLKERDARGATGKAGRVILVCPEDEYHELGIRIGADFYTIAGFEALFIGANTPRENILSAVEQLKPDVVNIGVSNFLHLVALKRIIAALREELAPGIRIAVSGSAFSRTGMNAADFGADGIVNTFEDIAAFGRNQYETGV